MRLLTQLTNYKYRVSGNDPLVRKLCFHPQFEGIASIAHPISPINESIMDLLGTRWMV